MTFFPNFLPDTPYKTYFIAKASNRIFPTQCLWYRNSRRKTWELAKIFRKKSGRPIIFWVIRAASTWVVPGLLVHVPERECFWCAKRSPCCFASVACNHIFIQLLKMVCDVNFFSWKASKLYRHNIYMTSTQLVNPLVINFFQLNCDRWCSQVVAK